MTPLQIILSIFFMVAIGKVFGRLRARELSRGVAIFWAFFWLTALLVVQLPDTTFSIARLVGVGRGADVVVYTSLAILFFVVFRLMVKINRQEQAITKLVREIALRDGNKQ